MSHTSSDDNVIYKSPSQSTDPSASDPYHSLNRCIETTTNLQPCGRSPSFRKFSSEPSLVTNPHRSVCSFRERMQSDCLEEESIDFQRNASESHVENAFCRMHTKKKLYRKHDHCHARLKLHAKSRRPLSDCGARVNCSLPMNETTAEQTVSSLSEEEIRSVCIDVFLER